MTGPSLALTRLTREVRTRSWHFFIALVFLLSFSVWHVTEVPSRCMEPLFGEILACNTNVSRNSLVICSNFHEPNNSGSGFSSLSGSITNDDCHDRDDDVANNRTLFAERCTHRKSGYGLTNDQIARPWLGLAWTARK
ncbi:hypothetical protein BC832DRAFT_460658 [Gaertneriomyces semiglobifer]|nr:hypothetical protein BC832DRAFT_460658 [Gaertneriomyces semiglobifer]